MEYLEVLISEAQVSIVLDVGTPEILEIGEKINQINSDAYMNGYNWEALINFYLEENAPELLDDLDFDSEAGAFVAFFDKTKENEIKAIKIKEIFNKLIKEEDELFEIIRESGEDIEWD